MARVFLFSALVLLAACAGYKKPGLSGNPQSMSGDTLCYRYAYAKSDPALAAEVSARNLDCDKILRTQEPIGSSRY